MAVITGAAELITKVLVEHHGISAAKVLLSVNATLRARILGNLQSISDDNWVLRDWTFRYVDDDIPTAAGEADPALPAGWANEGRAGLVTIDAGGGIQPLVWRPLREVKSDIDTGGEVGIPQKYSVSGLRTLLLYPIPAAVYTIYLYFLSEPPDLEDASPGGLDSWPVPWRNTVLYRGVVAKEMLDKGDNAAWPIQNAAYQQGIFSMCADEATGRPEPSFMPRFAGAAEVVPDYGLEIP